MNANENKLNPDSESDKSAHIHEKIIAQHKKAIENNEDTYIDPETGYNVFTAKFLLERNFCCGCGCRHCPY